MVSYHNGDILESGCDLIAHQVNVQGVMGGGLARQIAEKYPACEKAYADFVNKENKRKHNLLGGVFFYQNIANCFSQLEDFTTDYSLVETCMKDVKDYAEYYWPKTVAVPYKYGCGIAKGEWAKVEEVFKRVFENSKIDLQIWKLEEK